MLSTPGRSPRLLTLSPSPSPRCRQGTPGRSREDGSMGPPPPKKPRRSPASGPSKVLDEDTYVAAIERIVQRDYFPDIPRLQDRLEWLEAIRTGDPAAMRAAQIRIMTRRAERHAKSRGGGPGSTPSMTATPSGMSAGAGTPRSLSATPFGSVAASPGPSAGVGGGLELRAGLEGTAGGAGEGGAEVDTSMTLDEFLSRYTSEDNASFAKLQAKENKKRRAKMAHLLMLENGGGVGKSAALEGLEEGEGGAVLALSAGVLGENSLALMAVGSGSASTGGAEQGEEAVGKEDRKTDGYGSTGQPTSTLKYWPFKAKNSLMYDSSNREDAPLTLEEAEERAMGPPKEVVKGNTRFRGGSTAAAAEASKEKVEDTVAILYTPVPGGTPLPYVDPTGERGSRKHYDLEDLRRTPLHLRSFSAGGDGDVGGDVGGGGAGGVGGYEYVSTPSPRPGAGGESPFMTWGDIEGTPLRLEAEETPVEIGGRANGPHFTIPAAAPRDEAALTMSRSAAKSLKLRQQQRQGDLAGAGVSPAHGSGAAAASPSWLQGKRGAAVKGLASPSVGHLSAAAQKLVSKSLKKGDSGVDPKLRESYAMSPSRLHRARRLSASSSAVSLSSLSRGRSRSREREGSVSMPSKSPSMSPAPSRGPPPVAPQASPASQEQGL